MAEAKDSGKIIIENHVLAAGFVQVPVVVLQDADLSAGAKLAYGGLLWYAWKGGAYPGIDTLAADFGMGKRSAVRYLSELENRGYIQVTRPRLGKRNTYVLPDLSSECQSGTSRVPKSAPQERQSGTSHVKSLDSTPQTLSHSAPELAGEFFTAIGEGKPSKKRRERAEGIINDLTAEGFDTDTIRAAIRLAGERGARGPDLLPHVIGEAHERVQARGRRKAKAQEVTALGERAQVQAAEKFTAELQAVDALPPGERERLERECRGRLPAGISEGMAKAILPGMIAARMRGQ